MPIFPLPDTVLLPYRALPLHIFEPRYQRMVEDAVAGDRLIAMALLKEGWEKNYYKSPPVHEVMGLGRITVCEKLDGGRYNIMLLGLCRIRMLGEVGGKAYRLARSELMSDFPASLVEPAMFGLRDALLAKYNELCEVMEELQALREFEVPAADPAPLGLLTDAIACAILHGPAHMQTLLEESNVLRRASLISRSLDAILEELGHKQANETPPGDPRLN